VTEKTEHIIEALAFLICAEGGRSEIDDYLPPIHKVPAARFDGFEPMTGTGEDDWILVGKTAADQPMWPVDCAAAFPTAQYGEPDDCWPEGTWQFTRFKTLVPKEWRGVLQRFYPRMVDQMQMFVRPNGKAETIRTPYAILADGHVISPMRATGGGHGMNSPTANYQIDAAWFGYRQGHTAGGDDHRAIAMIGGMMLRKRYLWSVLIGEGKGPRARLFTDIVGMREIFRLRDIPPGKARRAALLHWVREHWRKRRDPTANDRAWVKAHIRGVWSYQWNGLLCQIVPSESDIDLLEPPP
jgi:hypothetical protein